MRSALAEHAHPRGVRRVGIVLVAQRAQMQAAQSAPIDGRHRSRQLCFPLVCAVVGATGRITATGRTAADGDGNRRVYHIVGAVVANVHNRAGTLWHVGGCAAGCSLDRWNRRR